MDDVADLHIAYWDRDRRTGVVAYDTNDGNVRYGLMLHANSNAVV